MEPLDGFRGLGPDLILDGQRAQDPTVRDDVQDRPPVATPGLGRRIRSEAQVGEEPGCAEELAQISGGTLLPLAGLAAGLLLDVVEDAA
jgi:hypothetical protein